MDEAAKAKLLADLDPRRRRRWKDPELGWVQEATIAEVVAYHAGTGLPLYDVYVGGQVVAVRRVRGPTP